jgi:hypothetical protein
MPLLQGSVYTQIHFFRDYTEEFDRYFKEPYLTWFKLNFTLDALHRRLTYKAFLYPRIVQMILKKKHVFFALRLWRDLTHPLRYDITDDLHAKQLGTYYFLFDENRIVNQKGATKSFVLDEEGIPVTPTYVDVTDKDYVYFPITIGQYGLAVFHTYLNSQSEMDRNRFLKIADWFYNTRIEDDRLGPYWLTDVSLPAYSNPGPWQSAFVQGRGISLLLRAYQLTGKHCYLEAAKVPTLVLNGLIFSLCGLYDFVRVCSENSLAQRLFREGVQTVIHALPAYDLGFWTRYNYCQAAFYPAVDPATVCYHRLHITQLKMLYRLTHEEILREYAENWARYDVPRNIAKMYVIKYRALRKIGRL